MHQWVKFLLIPAAIALATGTTASAMPGNSGTAAPASVQQNARVDATEVRHNYRHWRRKQARRDWRQYRRWQRHRYHYRPYRYRYAPRCYWSRYYRRRICRY